MLDDIFAWLVLNFALLYAAYWLWFRTHGSAHQQEQDKLIIKWAQDLEAKGQIGPLKQSSFVGDLIADSIPGRPEVVSKAIGSLVDIWLAILLFRWTMFGVLMIIGLAYTTVEKMIKYDSRIIEHNIDNSRMLYNIWTPGCGIITDADGNVLQYSTVDNKCSLTTDQIQSGIKAHGRSSAIKSAPSNVIWVYIFAFVWFFGILYLIDPIDDPDYNSDNVFNSFLIGWIVISALLFPVTFRDYPSIVSTRVDDINISVSTVYLSKDGNHYHFTSPTYMGKVLSDVNTDSIL